MKPSRLLSLLRNVKYSLRGPGLAVFVLITDILGVMAASASALHFDFMTPLQRLDTLRWIRRHAFRKSAATDGWRRRISGPIHVTDANGDSVETFVYPRNASDPSAEEVQSSFARDGQDFSSSISRVRGTLYVGRAAAGGEGTEIDLDNDGTADVTFDRTCAFILQLCNKRVIAGEKLKLTPFTPVMLD